jgi:hypothetical protein
LIVAVAGVISGAAAPRRLACVPMPPSWNIDTSLLSRGAISPSGLAVGTPGTVRVLGTRGLLRRANKPP